MDTDTLVLLLLVLLGSLAGTTANNTTPTPTTQMLKPEGNLTTTATVAGASDSQTQRDNTTAQTRDDTTAVTSTSPLATVTTETPVPTTAVAPALTVTTSNKTTSMTIPDAKVLPIPNSKSSPNPDSGLSLNQTSIVPTTTKKVNSTVTPTTAVTELVNNSTVEPHDNSEDTSTAQEAGLGTTETDTVETTLTSSVPVYPGDWLNVFLEIHHFEGQYLYDGRKYLFDFVVRNIHPLSTRTLVAHFYDEEGAILEMNGTSVDGHHVTFVLNKIYTAGYRFPANMAFELTGTLAPSAHSTYYDGNITKPVNSSFETFHMNKGLGAVETGDAEGTRTAIIVVVPVSIAFLGVVGTVVVLCWASKKGMLKGRHRSYQLFQDTPVVFESEAETIHI